MIAPEKFEEQKSARASLSQENPRWMRAGRRSRQQHWAEKLIGKFIFFLRACADPVFLPMRVCSDSALSGYCGARREQTTPEEDERKN